MKNKLFMGGLAWATTEASLRAACEKYGEIQEVRIITDQATGRSCQGEPEASHKRAVGLVTSPGFVRTLGRDQVTQVIGGAIGLDDWEWSVSLHADDPMVFKKLVTEMRFDPVSAWYAEFGSFYIGLLHQPGELTEAQLEALLFVAEKPLARSEIAQLAGVDRETVDARVGDLAVSLAGRGIRLVESGERVELATAPEAWEAPRTKMVKRPQ